MFIRFLFIYDLSLYTRTFSPVVSQPTTAMTSYATCISPGTIEQQVMWSSNGQHDDFLSVPRSGKLPDFQRIANFSTQPKNTHYTSSFSQVRVKECSN